MGALLRRLQYLWNRRRFERELDEEVRDHLERKAAESGSEADARRQFGNVTLLVEESRSMWTWNLGEQLAQDVRYALRTMKLNKLFTAMAVLSLALGIGANTAIYSFMDAILLRALPVDHPEQLVILNWHAKGDVPIIEGHWGSVYDEPTGGKTSPNFPYTAYELLRDKNTSLGALVGHMNAGRLNLVVDGRAELAETELVTGDYFPALGVPPAAGRTIGREDDRSGAPPVVVMAFDFWQSRFGSDPAVIGKTVRINGNAFTLAGVAAPEFFGVTPGAKPKIFIPIADIGLVETQVSDNWATSFNDHRFYWIELMGRLKPGVTMTAAQSELAGLFHNYVAATATKDRERADLPVMWLQEGGSGVDGLRRNYSKPLWILISMAALILLIACANIANLLLARASARRREIALRLSLGAGRFRVVRQLLTESLMLAVASAAAGVGVAAVGIRLLESLISNGEDLPVRVGIDWRVLSFTLLVAVATGILFGLVPAWQATRVDFAPALKETRGSDSHRRVRRFAIPFSLSQALVVAQIALSLLLVVAAGWFVRTLTNLHSVDLGFNAEKVLVFNMDASKAGYKDAAIKNFYVALQTRLQTLPGVKGVTTSDMPLVSGWMSSTGISVPGIPKPKEGERRPSTAVARVGTTFFETMQIPILAGRPFEQRDVAGSQPVVIVNQEFVDQYFHGASPVGQHFKLDGDDAASDVEIVGIAKTARYHSLKGKIPAVTYASWLQAGKGHEIRQMFFEVRTTGDPLELTNTVRQIVREASPLVPVAGISTQTKKIDQTISQERTFARLCTWFGSLALLMACVGLYGTMAYSVARRTSEIGIRMALGAVRGRIVWMVMREVLVLSVIGVAIGFGAVYESMTVVQSLLFGLKPSDPLALGVSVLVLAGCALFAGFMPAQRASRIDPMVALRHE